MTSSSDAASSVQQLSLLVLLLPRTEFFFVSAVSPMEIFNQANKHDLSRIPVGMCLEDPRNELVGYREEDSKLA